MDWTVITSAVVTGVFGFITIRYGKASERKVNQLREDTEPLRNWYKKKTERVVSIFVLDDNKDDLDLIERMLKNTGHPYQLFHEEYDYKEAIPPAANVHIIDHFLSHTLGPDMVREIKMRNQGNFIIIYTGAPIDDVAKDYLNAGAGRIVNKDESNAMRLLETFVNEGVYIIKNR